MESAVSNGLINAAQMSSISLTFNTFGILISRIDREAYSKAGVFGKSMHYQSHVWSLYHYFV